VENPVHDAERRGNRRFALEQPVIVESSTGSLHAVSGTTENASLQGVFVVTDAPLAEGLQVQVTILLQKRGLQGIRLQSSGKIVRVETRASGKFGIAIALEQFLTEISGRMRAS
jgi:PilZ domain